MGDKILLRGLLAMVFETEILLKIIIIAESILCEDKKDEMKKIIHIKVYKNL